MVTVSVMAPAVTLTLILLVGGTVAGVTGGDVTVPEFRIKLIDVPILPLDGVTVNGGTVAPGAAVTPGDVTVAVNVPNPVVVLVPVWPHSSVCVFGRTVNVVGVGVGGASPAGPAVPTTDGDSITRLSASVTTRELVPQPLCVTR